jgi:hypothetical protein
MGVWGKGPAFEASCPSSALKKLLAWERTLSEFGIPGCCAVAPRCTPFATLRSSAAHRTSSETNLLPNTLLAAVRESSRPARSASACPAECALTRSAVPRTTPENGDSSAPARCRSGSLAVVPARPGSRRKVVFEESPAAGVVGTVNRRFKVLWGETVLWFFHRTVSSHNAFPLV